MLKCFAAVLAIIALAGCGRESIDLIEEQQSGPIPETPDAASDETRPEAGSPSPSDSQSPVVPTFPVPSGPPPPSDGPSCDQPCPPYAKYCKPETLRCVECLNDRDCGRGVCRRPDNRCVQCVDMSDCSFAFYYAPVCDDNWCRPCISDDECADGHTCDGGGCFRRSPPPGDN